MHAWAAISHYLDYKADWDIPAPLRKGLNALSGLFYVADVQYEQLYASRQEARIEANAASSEDARLQPINLDTVNSMMRRIFPERNAVAMTRISDFVKELVDNDYVNIGQVVDDIEKSLDEVKKQEEQAREHWNIEHKNPLFYDLAASRIALKKSNKSYRSLLNTYKLAE